MWLALGIFAGVFLFAALAYEAQRRFSASDQTETVEGRDSSTRGQFPLSLPVPAFADSPTTTP